MVCCGVVWCGVVLCAERFDEGCVLICGTVGCDMCVRFVVWCGAMCEG